KSAPEPYIGITTGTSVATDIRMFGPPSVAIPAGQIAITNVAPDSPAAEAGLDIGDILVSMDGDRVEATTFDRRFSEKKIGATIQMTVMRRDRLLTIPVQVGSRPKFAYSKREKPNPGDAERHIFTSGLAEKKFEP